MIKEGNDHFEVTRQEPKVDFCEKKYVFDAVKPPDAKRDPVFDASAKCPAYVIPDEVAEAVREKQEADQDEISPSWSQRGTPVARINTGIDGGMHRVFAAKLPGGNTGLSEGGIGSRAAHPRQSARHHPCRRQSSARARDLAGRPLTASLAPAPLGPATRVASATPTAHEDAIPKNAV